MSEWTHVIGALRCEHHWSHDEQERGLRYGDVLKKAFRSPPRGSEGPLQVRITNGRPCGSVNDGPKGRFKVCSYQWTVTIFGDLRDYSDIKTIRDWLDKCAKKVYVREGIVRISVDYAKKSSIWSRS